MNSFFPSTLRALVATLFLMAYDHSAEAQATFRIGPRTGLNVVTALYNSPSSSQFDYSTSTLSRFEVGLVADISRGHWALQPGLVYSQKGFVLNGLLQESAQYQGGIVRFQQTTSLNYMCLPVNLAYTQKDNGQGFQIFGGSYIGVLIGGRYVTQSSYQGSSNAAFQTELPVRAGKKFINDGHFYSQRLDVGLQAGIGYRYGGALMQLSYSAGLSNLEAANPIYTSSNGPSYYNRVLQASVAYLFKVRPLH